MRLFRLLCLASLGLVLAAGPVCAKTGRRAALSAPAPAGPTVEITADESLEYYQDQRLYVARGKAKAVKGDSTIEADILTAKQKEATAGSPAKEGDAAGDIAYITAEGHVKISDPKQQVFGDRAVYDMDRKVMKVTGTDLKYLTEKDVVTARDSLEYFDDEAMAVARGRAVAAHQDSRIEADVLTAYFAKGAGGSGALDHIAAQGNVVILTKDGGVSRGDRGVYDAKKNKAVLMDHVRITRGQTQLAGDRGEVDFATGQSRLLNDGSGRVRALLPVGNQGNRKDGKGGL